MAKNRQKWLKGANICTLKSNLHPAETQYWRGFEAILGAFLNFLYPFIYKFIYIKYKKFLGSKFAPENEAVNKGELRWIFIL